MRTKLAAASHVCFCLQCVATRQRIPLVRLMKLALEMRSIRCHYTTYVVVFLEAPFQCARTNDGTQRKIPSPLTAVNHEYP